MFSVLVHVDASILRTTAAHTQYKTARLTKFDKLYDLFAALARRCFPEWRVSPSLYFAPQQGFIGRKGDIWYNKESQKATKETVLSNKRPSISAFGENEQRANGWYASRNLGHHTHIEHRKKTNT